MKLKFCIILLLSLAFSISMVYSQEEQIPIDSTRKIEIIDEELEQKLNLFPEYPDFKEARLYQKDQSNYILEITYKKDGKIVRAKREMNSIELEKFRLNLQSLVVEKAPSVGLDQSGRASFLTGTTLLSLGYYGWSVPYMLDIDNGGVFTGLYMITAGAGFFLPYSLTKETSVTKGMANLSIGAGTLGLAHGLILWDMFGLSESSVDQYGENDYNAKTLNLFMTVTSLSELLAGYFYAQNNNVSEGRANIIVSSSAIGGLFGLGAGTLIKEPEEWETWTMSFPALLGSAGGAVFGNYLANQQNFAPGDAAVMTQVGALGAMAGGTLLLFVEPEDYRVAVSTMMLATGLGLYAGHELIKGYDFTNNTANYISLGTFGGGLVGAGLAAILLNNTNDDTAFKLGATMVTAGAALGYGLTYSSLRKTAKTNKYSSVDLDFNINPTGFFTGNFNKQYKTSIPFMTLNCKF